MEKARLVREIEQGQTAWDSAIAQLGVAGLEHPDAVGRWRVRDVIAHFNGWNRWQLVQLRSAFTGEVPAESELVGGLVIEPDESLPFVDGLNAAFEEANRIRPLDDVLGDWREICGMRTTWVAGATQDQLDALVGADWSGTPGRYIRLISEVPGAADPKPAAEFVMDQIEHEREHLAELGL